MKYVKCILPLLLVSAIGLTGCNTNHSTQVSTTVEKTPNTSSNNTELNQNGSGSTNDLKNTKDTSLNQTENQSTNMENGASTPSNSDTPNNNPNKGLISSIMQLASQGKVENCEFAADTSVIDEVEKKWRKPDRTDAVGQGVYATYAQRNLAFGYTKGGQIFDVRSYDPQLKQITYMEVERILGTPSTINHYMNQDILVYHLNDTFQLEWVFPKPSKQEANPKLDHISVYCPKDVESLAAQ